MLDEKTIQLTNYYDIKHEAICACCLLMKRLRYIFPPSPLKVAVRGSGEGAEGSRAGIRQYNYNPTLCNLNHQVRVERSRS